MKNPNKPSLLQYLEDKYGTCYDEELWSSLNEKSPNTMRDFAEAICRFEQSHNDDSYLYDVCDAYSRGRKHLNKNCAIWPVIKDSQLVRIRMNVVLDDLHANYP